MKISLENWRLDITHLTSPLQDEVIWTMTRSLPRPAWSHISLKTLVTGPVLILSRNLLTCPGPTQPLPYRHATLFPKFLGKERDETKTAARETWGSYHLYRKTGNSNWKIKCFAPFRLEVSGNKSCDLKRGNFSTLLSLFSWFEYTLRRSFWQQNVYSFMFMDKISTRVIFV